jgi:hypothetical protein
LDEAASPQGVGAERLWGDGPVLGVVGVGDRQSRGILQSSGRGVGVSFLAPYWRISQ